MNMKILLVSLVVFSFLLAGCGGQKETAPSAAPYEPSAQAPTTPAAPSSPATPVAEEEVVVAPNEQGEAPVVEKIPGQEVPEVEVPPLEPEPQEVAPSGDQELAHLFDIEINEPPGEFDYGTAPGE